MWIWAEKDLGIHFEVREGWREGGGGRRGGKREARREVHGRVYRNST